MNTLDENQNLEEKASITTFENKIPIQNLVNACGILATDTLVKNIDYYLENEFYVFTATYLKKRGYCCKSNCRHCPY